MANGQPTLFNVPMSFQPGETLLGSLGQGIGRATPELINPYMSTGAAVGISLGSVLLQSLLGYQARQQAAERTLELNRLSTALTSLPTAQERSQYLQGLGDTDPLVLGRLGSLAGALTNQELQQKQLLDLERSKKMLGLEVQASPIGQELAQQEQERQVELIRAKNALDLQTKFGVATPEEVPQRIEQERINKLMGVGTRDKIADAQGQLGVLNDIAQDFRKLDKTAVGYQIDKQIPGSESDLAFGRLQANLSSTVRLLGEVGVLTDKDIQRIESALIGSRLSGTETIANKIEQTVKDAQMKLDNKIDQYQKLATSGIEALKSSTQEGATSTDKTSQLQAIQEQNAALLQTLNELKAARGQ